MFGDMTAVLSTLQQLATVVKENTVELEKLERSIKELKTLDVTLVALQGALGELQEELEKARRRGME